MAVHRELGNPTGWVLGYAKVGKILMGGLALKQA
jgi:hypothetical protein